MPSFKICILFILVALSFPGLENKLASAGGTNRRLLAPALPGDIPGFPTFPGAGNIPGFPTFPVGPVNIPTFPVGPGNIPTFPVGPGNIPGLPTTIPDPSRLIPPVPGFTGQLPTLPPIFPGTNVPGNPGGILPTTPILPPPETTKSP